MAIGRKPRRGRPTTGMTLVEVMVSMSVLAVALGVLAQLLALTIVAARSNREQGLAGQAARQAMERVQAADLGQAFALFNADPADDPGGAGSAPGAAFDVEGLDALANDADGLVGEVLFPTVGAELREDVQDAQLGMPRDLDGDGLVDALDKSGSYAVLPVVVRVRWRGAAGPSSVEYRTLLSEL